nr:ntcA [Porphyrostromium japonicum]
MSSTISKTHRDWLYKLLQSQNIFELLILKEGDVICMTNIPLILINMHGTLSTVKKYTHHKSFIFALSPPNTLLYYKTNESICYHKVQALTNSYVLAIQKISQFNDKIIRNEIRKLELKSLNLHLLYLDSLILLFTQNTIKKRLVVFLLTVGKQLGVFSSSDVVINVALPHAYLAEALGTTRVSVTRALLDLKMHFVDVERRRIVLHNPIALASYVLKE